jgi:hypothetical protein
MIPPTPGRVVWFFPSLSDPLSIPAQLTHDDPLGQKKTALAAQIARAWSNNCVNLMVIDGNGNPHSRTRVVLLQDGDERPFTDLSYCTWPEYSPVETAPAETSSAP